MRPTQYNTKHNTQRGTRGLLHTPREKLLPIGAQAAVLGPVGLVGVIEEAELRRLGRTGVAAHPRAAAITAGRPRCVVASTLASWVAMSRVLAGQHRGSAQRSASRQSDAPNGFHASKADRARRASKTDSKLNCSDLFASKRWRAGALSQPSAWGASMVRVLVASAFLRASCREPSDTAGENVTATKHGFRARS